MIVYHNDVLPCLSMSLAWEQLARRGAMALLTA